MNELNELYKVVFGEEPDSFKMKILVKTFGKEVVESVLEYFVIHPPTPPTEGKRNNPSGLLFKVCNSWEL